MDTVRTVMYTVTDTGALHSLLQIVLPLVFVLVVIGGGLLLYTYSIKQADPPLLIIDTKNRKKDKRKPQTKKSGQAVQDGEAKKKSADAKVSPKKEKVKEAAQEKKTKPKEVEKPAKKEKAPEVREPEKKTPKKEKKKIEKPADYDEGEWEKVPMKNEKKKKAREEQKEEEKGQKDSPSRDKREKKPKEAKKETVPEQKREVKEMKKEEPRARPVTEMRQALSPDIQEKINELQRVLNEVEKRDRSQTPVKFENSDSAPPTPDPKKVNKANNAEVKENVKPPKKEEAKEKATSPPVEENNLQFDELGDTWTEAKAPKKGKKKVRKDQ